MSLEVLLYQDNGGEPVSVQRFNQVEIAFRSVEQIIRRRTGRFILGYFEPGYLIEPATQDFLTDQARLPETRQADITFGISTRELFLQVSAPSADGTDPGLYAETLGIASTEHGTAILTDPNAPGDSRLSPDDFTAAAANLVMQMIAGPNQCDHPGCAGNANVTIPPLPGSGAGFIIQQHPRKKPRTPQFCKDTKTALRGSAEMFKEKAYTRRMISGVEDLFPE